MVWSILYFIWEISIPLFFMWYLIHLTYRRCNSKVCLVGKTALITGGNKGIGFHTSLGLASRGCRVIIACRSDAEEVKEKIINMTHNRNIVVKHLDQSSLISVRNFARELIQCEPKIDILINNAGIAGADGKHTEDGLNRVMETNYFGPFLLTHLLIDLLKKAGRARIIFVSSVSVWFNNLTLDNLNYSAHVEVTDRDALTIYGNSKFGQVIMSNIFAEKLKPYNITSNALHPGGVDTDIFDIIQNGTKIRDVVATIFKVLRKAFFKTPEEGAQPTLTVATSDEYEDITGTFLWDFKWFPIPQKIKDNEFCKKIWEETEKLVKLRPQERI